MAPLHLFVTGQPGVGKSTLVQRVLQQLQEHNPELSARGFFTEEVRQGGERAGFDVVTLDGRRGPLARVGSGGSRGGPTVGKYSVDVPAFESLALPELKKEPGVQLYVVDEVGKMELFSRAFYPAVTSLLDAAPVVLGTLPVARLGRAIPQVEALKARQGLQVVSITKENRDRKTLEVLAAVRMALGARSRGRSQ